MKFTFQPLTADTWKDFVELFGENGACGGCWCMAWRFNAADYNKNKGAGNKKAIHQLVRKNLPIGLLAYANKEPVGWCAVSPRSEYKRLESSKVLRPVDEEPVWSVSCFFIRKDYRNKGLSTALLKAVISYSKKNGASIVEGYPYDVKTKTSDVFVWTGLSSSFLKAGFEEVDRRSETRPIMRYYIN